MTSAWIIAVGKLIVDVITIPVSCHILPGPMKPGSNSLIGATLLFALINFITLINLVKYNVDPYPYGILYSGTLMLICVEVWYREDPQLLNGSHLKGYPFFLFHQPGATKSKAPTPMAGYTRVFGAWHAGGVCLCFFMNILGNDFPRAQKAQTSLALGLLWIIWGAINQWRSIYGAAQFCQMGIMIHSLVGPGCGLCGYWQLAFWQNNRTQEGLIASEIILLGTFASFVFGALIWLLSQERREAMMDKAVVNRKSAGPMIVRHSLVSYGTEETNLILCAPSIKMST